MRKLTYLFVLAITGLCLCGTPVRAQTTTTHKAVLTWNPSPDAAANPSLGYNVYRFQGTCPTGTTPTFTKVNSTPITALTYTDTNLQLGNVCYYVTATLNGVESVPSASAGGTVLPGAVTTVTVTVN